jgi:hypothetical protein
MIFGLLSFCFPDISRPEALSFFQLKIGSVYRGFAPLLSLNGN